jgi:hypothetical protein
MNTWSQIARHLDNRFLLTKNQGETVVLRWGFPTNDGEEVLQGQRVQLVEDEGRSYIAVVCGVVSSHRLPPMEALRLNMNFAVGALGLVDDTIVLRAYLDAEYMDLAELDHVVETTAREAVRLRSHLRGTASMGQVVEAMAHWM